MADSLNLIGNPYASPVSFKSIAQNNSTIKDKFYFWDPYLAGNYGVGGYVSGVPNLGGTYDLNTTKPAGAEDYTENIQSGQAIFVVTANNGAGQTLTINESDKTDVIRNTVFRNGSQNEMMSVVLELIAGGKTTIMDGTRAATITDMPEPMAPMMQKN